MATLQEIINKRRLLDAQAVLDQRLLDAQAVLDQRQTGVGDTVAMSGSTQDALALNVPPGGAPFETFAPSDPPNFQSLSEANVGANNVVIPPSERMRHSALGSQTTTPPIELQPLNVDVPPPLQVGPEQLNQIPGASLGMIVPSGRLGQPTEGGREFARGAETGALGAEIARQDVSGLEPGRLAQHGIKNGVHGVTTNDLSGNTPTQQRAVSFISGSLDMIKKRNPELTVRQQNEAETKALADMKGLINNGAYDVGGLLADTPSARFVMENKGLILKTIDNFLSGGGGMLRPRQANTRIPTTAERVDAFNRLMAPQKDQFGRPLPGEMIPSSELGSDTVDAFATGRTEFTGRDRLVRSDFTGDMIPPELAMQEKQEALRDPSAPKRFITDSRERRKKAHEARRVRKEKVAEELKGYLERRNKIKDAEKAHERAKELIEAQGDADVKVQMADFEASKITGSFSNKIPAWQNKLNSLAKSAEKDNVSIEGSIDNFVSQNWGSQYAPLGQDLHMLSKKLSEADQVGMSDDEFNEIIEGYVQTGIEMANNFANFPTEGKRGVQAYLEMMKVYAKIERGERRAKRKLGDIHQASGLPEQALLGWLRPLFNPDIRTHPIVHSITGGQYLRQK